MRIICVDERREHELGHMIPSARLRVIDAEQERCNTRTHDFLKTLAKVEWSPLVAKLRLGVGRKAISCNERVGRRFADVRGAVVEEEPHDLVCDEGLFCNAFEEAFPWDANDCFRPFAKMQHPG